MSTSSGSMTGLWGMIYAYLAPTKWKNLMPLLFETNGDWPSDDEDYQDSWIEDQDDCFFCDTPNDCICDSQTDWKIEGDYIEELEAQDD